MNRKGFTLIELLAVLVALGLVLGIGTVSISGIVKQSKVRSEEAFTETIKDAMDVYISSPDKPIDFNGNYCDKTIKNDDGTEHTVRYEWTDDKSIYDVVNSRYEPIKKNQLVNPANNKKCFKDNKIDPNTNEVVDGLKEIEVIIYRESLVLDNNGTTTDIDDDVLETRAYFYKIDKKQSGFNECFENFTVVDKDGNEIDANYISNLESPETFVCS